jgi:hypothetical protein
VVVQRREGINKNGLTFGRIVSINVDFGDFREAGCAFCVPRGQSNIRKIKLPLFLQPLVKKCVGLFQVGSCHDAQHASEFVLEVSRHIVITALGVRNLVEERPCECS